MDVFVLGLAMYPAVDAADDVRLEEMAWRTARAALDDAGVSREQLSHVTLAASDEIDARGISSMLLAAPAGAYLKDEMRTADAGMTGLQLGAMRTGRGGAQLGLVVSWNQASVGSLDAVGSMRAEPFYLRPIGMNFTIADGLLANALRHKEGVTEEAVAQRVHQRMRDATNNPRAIRRPVAAREDIAASESMVYPLLRAHCAPVTDGAVAMVLASGDWLRAHPEAKPLARIAGLSCAVDRYQLDGDRLGTAAYAQALEQAVARSGLGSIADLDVVEIEAQTAWADLAMTRVFEQDQTITVNRSGGAWAQNPYFCTSLVNAAEAVLQVSGRAGANQVAGAKLALAHGLSGFAQQAHSFVVFEGVRT